MDVIAAAAELPTTVGYAGLISAGLFQFNVTVPAGTPSGDDPLVATYNGAKRTSTCLPTNWRYWRRSRTFNHHLCDLVRNTAT